MIQDSNKSQGEFRLQVHKLPKVISLATRVFNAVNLNAFSTNLVNKFGTQVFDTGYLHNLGMDVRLAVVAGLYGNTGSQNAFTYLALGTSATAVAANQTTLVAEITDTGLARASATVSRVTTTVTNDTTQLTYMWTASGNKTINEIGYFNASSGGVMGGRALTGTITVANGVTLIATYKIKHT